MKNNAFITSIAAITTAITVSNSLMALDTDVAAFGYERPEDTVIDASGFADTSFDAVAEATQSAMAIAFYASSGDNGYGFCSSLDTATYVNTNFQKTKFTAKANVLESSIEDSTAIGADFSHTTLSENSNLKNTVFDTKSTRAGTGNAYACGGNFIFASLGRNTDFSNATFYASTDYANVKDANNSVMTGAKGGYFYSANFATVNFSNAKFESSIQLNGCTIRNEDGYDSTSDSFGADFGYGKFSGRVDFSKTNFTATINENDSVLPYRAVAKGGKFDDAEFSGIVDFSNAVFAASVSLAKNQLAWDGSRISVIGMDGLYMRINSGADFSNAEFSSKLTVDCDVKTALAFGADFAAAQLKSVNFQNVKTYVEINGENKTQTNGMRFLDATLEHIDFRGSNVSDECIMQAKSLKNVLLSDGKIVNFSVADSPTSVNIIAHTPTAGESAISAKIYNDDAVVSNAKLKLCENARLEVLNGKSLTLSEDGVLLMEINPYSSIVPLSFSENSSFVITESSPTGIGTWIVIDMLATPQEGDVFTVMEWSDGCDVSSLYNLIKDKNIGLTLNDSEYLGDWDFSINANSLSITIVPEPSTYAVIFGMFALCFAIYRRRK